MDVALRMFGEVLVPAWSTWNSHVQIPAGHFACLKVINYEVPLNLFQNVPAFQL